MSDIPRCPLCGLGTVIAEELRATGRWVYCQCCDGEYRDEITRLTVEVERLTAMHGGSQRALAKVIAENTAKQAVVDAALAECKRLASIKVARAEDAPELHNYQTGKIDAALLILRALDGEQCPDCVDGIAPKGGNEGSTRYVCPTCHGEEVVIMERPCPDCGGTGRRG